VQSLEAKKAGLQTTLQGLRSDLASLEGQSAQQRGLSDTYTTELERLNMLAGLVPVEGPGVTVTLADNPHPPEGDPDPNNYIIHDYDLRVVINALWEGGAEAVAVDQQRIVQSSAVRCVGTTILVNNTRVGSPFVIQAIGPKDRLRATLSTDREARRLLEQYAPLFGLEAAVDPQRHLSLPGYSGVVSPRTLRPAGPSE